jgi:hypothetical protein
MKRYTMNMTLAVAALTLAVGTVSAQTMKAEIPFAFHVGNKVMQPGEYHVSRMTGYTGTSVWKLSNVDAKQSVLMLPVQRAVPSKAWSEGRRAKMSFLCGQGPCTLERVWSGEGDAYLFHSPRGKNGEPHIAEITLRPDRAN